jgi:hypothetical protein
VDEDEARLPVELQGQVDVDPKQLHIGAPGVGGRGRTKKANGGGRAADGGMGLGPEGTALPHTTGAGKGGKGGGVEHDEEALRLKRLERELAIFHVAV